MRSVSSPAVTSFAGSRGVIGRSVLLLLACGLALACYDRETAPGHGEAAGDSGRVGWDLVQRLIPEEPDQWFRRQLLADRIPAESVASWSFDAAAELAQYFPVGTDLAFRIESGDLLLQGSDHYVAIHRALDEDAGAFDTVELVAGGLQESRIFLQWAKAAETEMSRSMELRTGDEPGLARLRFPVAAHPDWVWPIQRIALGFGGSKGQLRTIRAVRFLRTSFDLARLRPLTERPWRVELDHETRDALLAVPGADHSFAVDIPENARLTIGLGRESGAVDPVELRMSLEVDGRRQEILNQTLGPEADELGRWLDRQIDLSAFAGPNRTLHLEARSPSGAIGSLVSTAFWSVPRILEPAAETDPANLLLISVDTLRADHLSLYGYERETSPNLDRFGREQGATFVHAISPAPSTLPSHASLFTGLNAHRHRGNHSAAPGSLVTLAEVLRAHGWLTAAVTGGGYLHPRFGLDQGFETYFALVGPQPDELALGTERALAWLGAHSGERFFLLFHTYEVHSPFLRTSPFGSGQPSGWSEGTIDLENLPVTADAGYVASTGVVSRDDETERSLDPKDATPLVVDRYDNGIRFMDAHLGSILDRLRELGLMERTVVVVTSDHGEALGEQERFGHGLLSDDNLRVPLIIALPDGLGRGRRIHDAVRLVDLVPTLLEILGVEALRELDGVSFLPLLRGDADDSERVAWSYASNSNHGLALRIGNRFKYLYNNSAHPALFGREQLFDLQSDPGEVRNVGPRRDLAKLRERVLQETEAVVPGLRVRLRGGAEPYAGEIRGNLPLARRTVGWRIPARRIVWNDDRQLAIEVRPGDDFLLGFEELAAGDRLEVRLEAGGRSLRRTYDVTDDPRSLALALSATGWTELDEAARPEALVTIAWHRDGPARKSGPELSSEVEEQLRALGYLQ